MKLPVFPNPKLAALAEKSVSWNGYVREESIKELKKLNDSRAIPIFIERLNDWVPAVREQATEAFLQFMTPLYAADIVQYLPMLLALQKRLRYDHKPLIDTTIKFLLEKDNIQYLLAATQSEQKTLAYFAFRICSENQLQPPIELLAIALKSKNLSVIKMAYPLIDNLSDSEFLTFSEKLLLNKFSPLSVKAARRIAKIEPSTLIRKSEQLLFANNQNLRRIAQECCQLADSDAIIFYKEALGEESIRKVRIAIVELSERLNLLFQEELRAFAIDSRTGIRRVALQQLGRILGEDAKSLLLAGLLNEDIAIRNESARLLVKYRITLSTQEILIHHNKLIEKNRLETYFYLARKNGKWTRLEVLFSLLEDANEECVNKINTEISNWHNNYNRSSAQIENQALINLKKTFDRLFFRLDTQNQDNLRFLFKTLIS